MVSAEFVDVARKLKYFFTVEIEDYLIFGMFKCLLQEN